MTPFSPAPTPRRQWLSRTALGLSAFTAIGLVAGCATLMGPRNIEATHPELQGRLDRQFPLSRRIMGLIDVTALNPRLTLHPESARVRIDFDLKGKEVYNTNTYNGNTTLSFGLRYEPRDHTVRLAEVRVDNIAIKELTAGFQALVLKVANKVADEAMSDLPIYQFKQDQLHRAESMGYAIKDIQIQERLIALRLVPKGDLGK
jgi:Protein of unknown function (DUF1439)